jgi:predicted deacylase
MRIVRRSLELSGLREIIQRRIPLLIANSGRPGPQVCLTACIHGDEVGGIAIVHDLFARLRKTGLRCGAVHAFPLINSLGFENATRFITGDGEDLNRCFPGKADGSMGQQIASRVFNAIKSSEPDLVIDLHNDWFRSVPYLLLEPGDEFPSQALYRRTIKLANATGLPLVQDSEVFDPNANTLAGAFVAAKIAAFTIEAGGSLAIAEQRVEQGLCAILAVLAALDMLANDTAHDRANPAPEILHYSDQPRPKESGLARFHVQPGEQINAGQRLASVYSPFGSCGEVLVAANAGIVLGLDDHARALPDRPLLALAERI